MFFSLNWVKAASFLSDLQRWTFALINKSSLMIFSVTLQLSQSLTCEGEREREGGGDDGRWGRGIRISVPGLYGAQSEWAHQYSLSAPARVPGDRQDKVAEVTHFTSRGERGQEREGEREWCGGRSESKEKHSPEGESGCRGIVELIMPSKCTTLNTQREH